MNSVNIYIYIYIYICIYHCPFWPEWILSEFLKFTPQIRIPLVFCFSLFMCVFGFCYNRLAQGRSGVLFLHVHHHHPVDVNDVQLMAKMCQGSSGGPAHLPRRLRGSQTSLASAPKTASVVPNPSWMSSVTFGFVNGRWCWFSACVWWHSFMGEYLLNMLWICSWICSWISLMQSGEAV